jgi:integrase
MNRGKARKYSIYTFVMAKMLKWIGKITCNIMSNSVAARPDGKAAVAQDAYDRAFSLYATNGARKYLNRGERRRVLAVMAILPSDRALFSLTLAWTGARISEVLALTPASFQIEPGLVTFRTLKRRRFSTREVPIPPSLMTALDRHFQISATQRDPAARIVACGPGTASRRGASSRI